MREGQAKQQNAWIASNYKKITFTVKKQIASDFKDACSVLGKSQSSVIKQSMLEIISKVQKQD